MHVLLSSFIIPSLRSDDNHHSEDVSLLYVAEKVGAEKIQAGTGFEPMAFRTG